MLAYRSRMKSALDGLDATPMPAEWRDTNRTILQNNIAFMDDCLAKGMISFAALEEFAKKQGPHLKKIIAWAAQTQVGHWMGVIADWKKMLGADWDKAYAASNTIYVARQNNVLFSVLAQFFGPDAINDRLMLIETISFTTTPDDMLDVADPHHRRPLGRRAVLRQLPPDGLRADGRRRARRHHRRDREARHEAVPAAGGAVRLEAMADPGHAGPGDRRSPTCAEAGARWDRVPARRRRRMDLNTITEVKRPASADEIDALARRVCLARRRHLAVLRAAARRPTR